MDTGILLLCIRNGNMSKYLCHLRGTDLFLAMLDLLSDCFI